MNEPLSILLAVLWDVLDAETDEETGELSQADAQRVRRTVCEWLETNDAPSSRQAGEIADFIYWNCAEAERDAAERWLATLTVEQREALVLGDLMEALQVDAADGINQLAEESKARLQ